ncbi:MAG: hypothetical protein H7X80_04300 [bacterium]|nr:hypothetical protein [Candidatus Kapabacteria bacterium]
MLNEKLHDRIISTADEYHLSAEDYWTQVVDLKPEGNEELDFEFRRLVRAALVFYSRAYLELDMVETDDSQDLEDLLDIVLDQVPEFRDFFAKNDVMYAFGEDTGINLSRLFSVAEAVRTMLLEQSNQLAASLNSRFS